MAVTFRLECRWDGVNWTDESAYLDNWLVGIGMPANNYLTHIAETGTADFILNNASRRFSPGNSSSPIYAYLNPSVQIRIFAVDVGTLTSVGLFYGFIREITAEGQQYGSKLIVFRCMDLVEGLKWQRCSVAYAATKNVATAISQVAAQGYGVPPGTSYEDIGDVITDFGKRWFDIDRHSVYDGLKAICQSFFGYFYVGRNGYLTYRSRYIAYTAPFDPGSFLINDNDIKPGGAFVDSKSYDMFVNHARVTCYPPEQAGALAVLWTKASIPSIKPGVTRVLSLPFRDNNTKEKIAATGVIAPVASTDYVVNTVVDGSGSDITAMMTVSASIEARRVVLTVTNNTAYTAYFTTLQVRGYPLLTYDPVTVQIDNSAGVLRRLWEVDAVLLGDIEQAYGFCNHIIQRYTARHFCRYLDLPGGVAGDFNDYLNFDLFTDLRISESQSGLSQSWHVIRRIEYTPDTIRLYFEPKSGKTFFQLDLSGLDNASPNAALV